MIFTYHIALYLYYAWIEALFLIKLKMNITFALNLRQHQTKQFHRNYNHPVR